MRNTLRSAVATVAILALTACSGATPSPTVTVTAQPTQQSTEAAPSTTAVEMDEPVEGEEVEGGEMVMAKWGETVTLGPLEVTVGKPAPYEASDQLVGEGQDVPPGYTALAAPITMKNVGKAPVEPWTIYLSGTSGDAPVKEFQEVMGREEYTTPDANILPGKTIKFNRPLSAKNPSDIALQVDYGRGTMNIEATAYYGN